MQALLNTHCNATLTQVMWVPAIIRSAAHTDAPHTGLATQSMTTTHWGISVICQHIFFCYKRANAEHSNATTHQMGLDELE
jgi:hypothetical protein